MTSTWSPKDFLYDYAWRHFRQGAPPPLAERLWGFLEFLLAESKKYNLTAIQDPHEMVSRHFVDALAPLTQPQCPLDKDAALRVVDVGSGNGVPGFVLALAFPQWRVTLLEANGKKVEFLRQAAARLGAENVEVVQSRAEVAGRDPARRDAHGLVVARALAMLPTALELCLPFARPGGWLLAYKGEDCANEIAVADRAFEALRGRLTHAVPYVLEPTTQIHTALWIEKTAATPAAYPRRDGLPKKNPLWHERRADDRRPRK